MKWFVGPFPIGLLVLLVVVALLITVVLVGPRDSFGDVPTLPDYSGLTLPELEARIEAAEVAVPGLREDSRKRIVWFQPELMGRTRLSLVFLHGYTASRREFDPVPLELAQRLGANLFYTRFAGHGYQGPDGHRGIKAAMWAQDMAEAVAVGRALGEKVVLLGSSTGATLAAWAMTIPEWEVAAGVLVSPNFGTLNPMAQMLSWPWSPLLVKLFVGDYRTFDRIEPGHYAAWDVRHHSDSLLAMGATVAYAGTMDLSRTKAPILVVMHPQDPVVNSDKTRDFFERWPAPKKLVLSRLQPPNNYHVLAGDLLSPGGNEVLVEAVLDFLADFLPVK